MYNENKNTTSKNFNNRVNLRIEYAIDSSNLLTFSFAFATFTANSKNNSAIINSTNNTQTSKQVGFNFSNDILYQHKFAKKGRTISFNLNTSGNFKNTNGTLFTYNQFETDSTITVDSIDQKSTLKTKSYTLGGNHHLIIFL